MTTSPGAAVSGATLNVAGSGTDVAVALSEFRAIEGAKDEPKSALVAAKRKLARAMNS